MTSPQYPSIDIYYLSHFSREEHKEGKTNQEQHYHHYNNIKATTSNTKTMKTSEKTPLLSPASSVTSSSTAGKKTPTTTTKPKTVQIQPSSSSPSKKSSSPSKSSKKKHSSNKKEALLIKAASRKVNLRNVHHKRDIEYSNSNGHFAILFQMYGSVWPNVLPWCLLISALSAGIYYLRYYDIADITIRSNAGHGFISILVSFLVVTRTTITYSRFMEARQHLEDLFRCSRELIQYACAYTIVDDGIKAKEWRRKVAYRTIITLRMAVAAAEYRGHGVNAWETLHKAEHVETPLILPGKEDNENEEEEEEKEKKQQEDEDHQHNYYKVDHSYFLRDLSHGPRSLSDENFRAPIVWIYNLRETIVEIRNDVSILPKHPMHVNECLKLNAFASDLNTSFHGLKKLITTPFPFPLVQMTRTFLFFWLLSLPFVLVPDYDYVWEICVLMFFVTYGFLGLEYVNMELDDPHGQDANDFPGHRWAQQVFEDIYITIYKNDGFDSAIQLRNHVAERVSMGTALENFHSGVSQ